MQDDGYESVLKLMEGKQCAKCKQIKFRFEFEREISKAQAKAWGYAGNVAMTIESKNCAACQPTPKAYEDMSIKEIEYYMESGDLSPLQGQRYIEAIKRRIRNQRSRVTSRRWEQVRDEGWKPLLEGVRVELAKTHQQEKNASKIGVDREFFFEYKQALQRLRDEFKFRSKHKGEMPEKGYDWIEYMEPELRRKLYKLWMDTVIPPKYKTRMRLPEVVQAPLDLEAFQAWTAIDEGRQKRAIRLEEAAQRLKENRQRALLKGEGPAPAQGFVKRKIHTDKEQAEALKAVRFSPPTAPMVWEDDI